MALYAGVQHCICCVWREQSEKTLHSHLADNLFCMLNYYTNLFMITVNFELL